MKRFAVRLSRQAEVDIEAIYFYVLEASANVSVADAFERRLEARINRLGDAPYAFRSRDDLFPGWRMAFFERRAAIAYIVAHDHVLVTNVFYGGQDYEALIRGMSPGDDETD